MESVADVQKDQDMLAMMKRVHKLLQLSKHDQTPYLNSVLEVMNAGLKMRRVSRDLMKCGQNAEARLVADAGLSRTGAAITAIMDYKTAANSVDTLAKTLKPLEETDAERLQMMADLNPQAVFQQDADESATAVQDGTHLFRRLFRLGRAGVLF